MGKNKGEITMKTECKTLGLGLVEGLLGVGAMVAAGLALVAPLPVEAAAFTPATVWVTPAGSWIPAATETNLPTTADLGWLDLTQLRDTNLFFALTCYGCTDGTSSNLCILKFAPSVDRIQWDTNYAQSLPTVRFALTNRVPATYDTFTVVTNGSFFGSLATAYPYYRLVNVTNMTAKILSNATLRVWGRNY